MLEGVELTPGQAEDIEREKNKMVLLDETAEGDVMEDDTKVEEVSIAAVEETESEVDNGASDA